MSWIGWGLAPLPGLHGKYGLALHRTQAMQYLKPDEIVKTIATLRKRIQERFPDSGLGSVCSDLLAIAEDAEQKTKWFSAPVVWLRVLCWVIVILIVAGSAGTLLLIGDDQQKQPVAKKSFEVENAQPDKDAAAPGSSEPAVADDKEAGIGLAEFVQLLEAGINDIVLIGAAIFFLMSLETRYKRGRALESIHELRSIAHIIDMHQLTKDPERITNKNYSNTDTSPRTNMTRFELRRYFDYCSEMLSLTGKIAAVYVQEFNDMVVLASVNEVETLCTGLSRKIWQKLSILHEEDQDAPTDQDASTHSEDEGHSESAATDQ